VRLFLLLSLLVALAVLPLAGFAVAQLYGQWVDGQRRSERQLSQSVRSLSLAVERELAATARQLERIAALPLLDRGSLAEFHAYAVEVAAEQRDWDQLLLLAPDGEAVLDTRRPFGADTGPREALPVAEAVRSLAPVVSDIYASAPNGAPAVAVLVPVVREGAVRWVLAARLDDVALSELLTTIELPAGFVSSIVDRNGLIVGRSRELARFQGRPSTPEYLALIGSRPSGSGRTITLEGEAVLAAWHRLPGGWVVGMGSLAASYDAALTRSLWTAAIAGAVMLAAGLAAGGLLSRRIALAVDDAAEDAARLAAQQPVASRRSRIAELDALSDALHRAGQRLERIAHERNAATRELNDALGRLRLAVQRRDELLAMLAHELRNPLAPILNATRLLEREPEMSATGRRGLEMIARQTGQLARLVDDLLDASRLVNGKVRLRLAPTSLSATVREIGDAMRAEVESSSQRLVVEVPDDPVDTLADAARITQALHNLLANAVKFGGPGGTVRLTLQVQGPEALITVSDTGIGIDPARLDDLFEPFVQIDPGLARVDGGLGLGLATVRGLVTLHDGSVRVDSEGPGRGARFEVRLPLRPPQVPPPAPGERTPTIEA
jgi:signal transduction histidine kinase